MFDIGWSELVIIGIVALIAIGPKELPAVLRTVGQWMGKVRRMASEFQGQFQEAMREAEMADLKKQVDDVTSTVTDYANFDPMDSVRKEVDSLSADPFAETAPEKAPETPAAATLEAASPEAASQGTPAPVSPDFSIPQPSADTAVTPEAPQPADTRAAEAKAGSGG